MYSSHAAAFIQVRHTAFGQFASCPLQLLAALPSNAPPIRIHLLLLLFFAFPIPTASLRLRNVAAAVYRLHILQHGSAVITLVGDHLLDSFRIDLRLFAW